MKHMNDEQLQLVSGGEMSTPSTVILIAATLIHPVVGASVALGYFVTSDMKDCG
jgi:hypothetical protein